MTNQEIITGLYLELLVVAVILIGILFINNIVLYKQKLKDRISVMLLTSMILGCFEILWASCEEHPDLRALTYIGACGYMILFVIFTVLLNRYILFRFNRLPKSKWATILFYIVLICALLLSYFSLEINMKEIMQKMHKYISLFCTGLLLLNLLSLCFLGVILIGFDILFIIALGLFILALLF